MKPARAKRLIRRDVKAWRGVLDLDGWRIRLYFGRQDSGTVACCEAKWEYREATLSFDPDQLANLDRDEIRETVLHELLHCCCSGYERWQEHPMLEEMVSRLATIVLRCWEAPAPKVK